MLKMIPVLAFVAIFSLNARADTHAADNRIAVEMPEEVKAHFLKKMHEHLVAVDSIIAAMADQDLALAANVASEKLAGHGGGHKSHGDKGEHGTDGDHGHKQQKRKMGEHSSVEEGEHSEHQHGQDKGASHHDDDAEGEHKKMHMGRYMPKAMKMLGKNMHGAAIEFSEVAREGDSAAALKALRKITASCVACHQAYRIEATNE